MHKETIPNSTLNPPPTVPRTFSIGMGVLSKWSSHAKEKWKNKTHVLENLAWKIHINCNSTLTGGSTLTL